MYTGMFSEITLKSWILVKNLLDKLNKSRKNNYTCLFLSHYILI